MSAWNIRIVGWYTLLLIGTLLFLKLISNLFISWTRKIHLTKTAVLTFRILWIGRADSIKSNFLVHCFPLPDENRGLAYMCRKYHMQPLHLAKILGWNKHAIMKPLFQNFFLNSRLPFKALRYFEEFEGNYEGIHNFRFEPKIDIPRNVYDTGESFDVVISNETGIFSFKVQRHSTKTIVWDTSIGW